MSEQKFSRPKRTPEQAVFTKRLYDLLQRPARGKPHTGKGYDGHIRITRQDLYDHLFCRITLAVSCVNENGSNFLAWDVDESFPARLPSFAKVLRRRDLEKAAVATTGSTPERGKIIVALNKHIPQPFSIKLAKEILAEAMADPNFGEVKPSKLTPFPTEGDGSYCRIGGSKYGGPLARPDRFIDLNGHPTDLTTIVPAVLEAPSSGTATTSKRRELSAWAQTFLTQPFTGTEPQLFKAQTRLVQEAITIFGDDAESKFSEWMESISNHSAIVSNSVRGQLNRADAFRRAATFLSKVKSKPSWIPLQFLEQGYE